MSDFVINNYHTHTTRCKHAWGTEREYIETAIEAGIKKLGFSDHVPINFKDGYVSHIRMDWDQAPEYVSCIRKLAEEYKSQIEILVGFEAEYIPEFFDEQCKMYDDLGIDYLILGQHFLNNEEIGPYTGTPSYDEALLKQYVDTCLEGMSSGRFKYLAHPDLMNFCGDPEIYQKHMERLCREMKAKNLPLEINLLGIKEHKHYPSDRFYAIAGKVGNEVIFGLDAHTSDQLCNLDCYNKGMELVKTHNLMLIEDV